MIPKAQVDTVMTAPPTFVVTGSITGKVTQKNKKEAVPNASISVYKKRDLISKGVSDSDGKYLIVSIPTGKYTLIVQKHGFQEVEIKDVIVKGDMRAYIDLKLIPIKKKSKVRLVEVIED